MMGNEESFAPGRDEIMEEDTPTSPEPFRFRPLTLDRLRSYRPYYRAASVHSSDASPGVLWGWADICGYEIAFDGPPESGLAWIRQCRPKPALLPPQGTWRGVYWGDVLERLEKSLKADPCPTAPGTSSPLSLVCFPEELMPDWAVAFGGRFSYEPCRDVYEYLHRTSDLATYRGNRLMRKRNRANRFARDHRSYEYLPVDGALLPEIRRFQEEWLARRIEADRAEGRDDARDRDEFEGIDLKGEQEAILRTLSAFDELELRGGALRTEGRIVAYTLAEAVDDRTLMIHTEKADPACPGAFQAICRDFLVREGGGFDRVNREEDMGLPGLRKAKLSYQPAGFLRKGCARLSLPA
jgi:hypothetical protein